MIYIKENERLNALNHSATHLLANAVKNLYPHALFWMSEVLEDGFYYDIDLGNDSIKEEDLKLIEREMKNISKSGKNDFIDLCLEPHVESVKEIKHFKLLKVSGAYLKGDATKKMIQRVYGICFENEKDLKDYLDILEEAKNRDHRKIGKELDLFCFSDLVGPGLPLFTPKGTIIKEELQKAIEKICRSYGFQKVFNPHLANIKLFETSGHAQKFSEELFHVTSEKGHDLVLKPVLCPHHTQLFASKMRSYRDLPIRYMESEKQYRAELPGAVSGLSRVYAITIEDGHSFCRVDQVKEEVIRIVNIIKDFYTCVGLWDSKWVSLSVRDYETPEKYIGDPKDWDICESMLEEISNELGLNAKRCEGEAALYGPKLDFMFKDVLGREIQIPTVQLDFATPKRFNLVYTDSEGNKVHPVMVHRAILGSYERFMMLLIENYAGAFPLWLSPVQINIVPVNNKYHLDYCNKLKDILINEEIRVELDDSSEKMNYKIRQSNIYKNPYTLIIGDKERDNNKVSYRLLGSFETETMDVDDFIRKIKKQIMEKTLNN